MAANDYAVNVFINFPFDAAYKPLFEAIVFAILNCGHKPRCALEIDDGSEVHGGLLQLRIFARRAHDRSQAFQRLGSSPHKCLTVQRTDETSPFRESCVLRTPKKMWFGSRR